MTFAKLRNALFLVVVASAPAFAQSSPGAANQPPPTSAATADLPEISTQEQMPSFQVKVNLVEIRAVVRDRSGKAVGNLKQEDFVVIDDKKPQTITRFSVERNEVSGAEAGQTPAAGNSNEVRSHLAGAWRLAYLFDDLNSTANDLINARKAAEQAIDALAPEEQLGIFTLSGQGTQDFTGDKERLRAAVRQLQPRPQGASTVNDCPPINYYIADQLKTYNDPEVFKIVLQQVIGCQFGGHLPLDKTGTVLDPVKLLEYENATRVDIDRVYRAGEAQSDIVFQSINEVLHHVSQFAGQRTLVLLSPGFYLGLRRQADLTDSLNRAIAGGVVINTLDLRGVVAQQPVGTDISQPAYGSSLYTPNMVSQQGGLNLAQADTLMQIANTTGGKYLHNTNDISGGLAALSAPPEFSYLLGFAPQNLQNDGKFHALKVELTQPSGYTVQARTGYYAPRPGGSSEQVEREIAEAVFGHDEINQLPVRVQTQFFKSGADSAKVSVLVHVDVRHMQFKKADGRNLNELTVVAALFDRNANLVTAKSSTVKMHTKDDTLAGKLNSGVTVRSNFDVNPGSYLVRIVARDEQGKMLTQNEVVDIP
jgi:VWFA-related protein